MGIRNNFFSKQVGKHWNRLPRKLLESPSQEVFKGHADVVLRTWFSGKLGSAELMDWLHGFRGLFPT